MIHRVSSLWHCCGGTILSGGQSKSGTPTNTQVDIDSVARARLVLLFDMHKRLLSSDAWCTRTMRCFSVAFADVTTSPLEITLANAPLSYLYFGTRGQSGLTCVLAYLFILHYNLDWYGRLSCFKHGFCNL